MFQQTGALFNGAVTQVMSLSLEFFVVGGIVALFLGYSLYRGKSKVVSILISLHITGLLFILFPYWDFISEEASSEDVFAIKVALFAAAALVINMRLKRMIESVFSELKLNRMIEAFALAVVTTGVLFAYLFHVLDFAPLYQFSPPLDAAITTLFLSESAFFWWIAGSVALLLTTSRK